MIYDPIYQWYESKRLLAEKLSKQLDDIPNECNCGMILTHKKECNIFIRRSLLKQLEMARYVGD